jgi:hypothetical protein
MRRRHQLTDDRHEDDEADGKHAKPCAELSTGVKGHREVESGISVSGRSLTPPRKHVKHFRHPDALANRHNLF